MTFSLAYPNWLEALQGFEAHWCARRLASRVYRDEKLMRLEPATRCEIRSNARCHQPKADSNRADDPARLKMSFRDKPVKNGQYKDKHRSFGKERGTTVSRDRDEIDKARGCQVFRGSAASGRDKNETRWRGWILLRRVLG